MTLSKDTAVHPHSELLLLRLQNRKLTGRRMKKKCTCVVHVFETTGPLVE